MTTILFVEDDDLITDLVKIRLERNGYDIILASDGVQALAVAQAEEPALILMDLSLPLLSGWQAARQLKNLSATRDIPIIALTAHAFMDEREQAITLGCDDYETKPINFSKLISKIETCLAKKNVNSQPVSGL